MTLALIPITAALIVRTLVLFVILGLCAWLIDQFVPMPAPMKTVFRVIIVLLVVLWLLTTFGII